MAARGIGRRARAAVGGLAVIAACAACGSEEPATPSAGTSSSAAVEEPAAQPAELRVRPVVQGPEPSVTGSGSGGITFDPAAPAVGLEQVQPAYAQLDCAAQEDRDATRPEDYAALCSADDTVRYLLGPAILDVSQVADATARADDVTGQWVVDLQFDDPSAATWSEYTGGHVGEGVAFTVDGQVISAPVIQSAIAGLTTLTGQFSEKSATRLAARLDAG